MSDPWQHKNKEWRATLGAARKRGWPTPTKATNHGGVTLNCPSGARECRIRIFSTGKGTEGVARDARKTIGRCPHGDFDDKFDAIEHHLDSAERLLAAAAAELERRDAETEAEALLQIADDPIASAAELLDAVQRYDVAADTEAELRVRRDELLEEGEAKFAPDELVGAAGSDIRDATLGLRGLPSAATRFEELSERLRLAQDEHVRLKTKCAEAI